jgi:nucleoside-diphosphate-sugar epimerase
MKKVCVIGASGFVGKALCEELVVREDFQLIKITRQDDMKEKIKQSDIIIHSANSSKRYFANQNYLSDLFETIEKMLKVIKYSRGKKIILISTVSARIHQNTPYGRHRRACELLLNEEKDLIVRMANMFGENNKKGALFDILNNKTVYASEKTKCSFVDVKYNASKVVDLVDSVGVVEVGAKDCIELGGLAKRIGSTCTFVGPDDTQIPRTKLKDAPSAEMVFGFLKKFQENKNE